MTDQCRTCMGYALRVRELEAEVVRLTHLANGTVPLADVAEVFQTWQQVCGHENAQLTEGKRIKIGARLREKPVVGRTRKEDLLMAIQGAAAHAYTDDNGVRHDGIETIFRNAEKVELNLQRYEASRAHARAGASLESKLIGGAA